MIRVVLRRGDGLSSGRDWLDSVVKCLQLALIEAGHPVETADGKFGSGTEKAVKAFQQVQGLSQSGIVDKPTWVALSASLQAALGPHQQLIAELLSGFEGDLGWVHRREGHRGAPYWRGEAQESRSIPAWTWVLPTPR